MKYFIFITGYLIIAFIVATITGKILKFGIHGETPKPKKEKK